MVRNDGEDPIEQMILVILPCSGQGYIYSFGPVNWQIGAIDISRSLVFEVLEPRVTGFL